MIEPNTAVIIATGGARATRVTRILMASGGSSSEGGILGPARGSTVQRTRI